MKTLLIIDANLGQARAYMAKTLLGSAAHKANLDRITGIARVRFLRQKRRGSSVYDKRPDTGLLLLAPTSLITALV
ncbi:hypothetical protein MJM83_31565, partial [Salmonella enterica subsp. enterica serovar Montevideo]|nr:hypothetical protein [Salmonella enterica subsp. enterica serovar Montevideo]